MTKVQFLEWSNYHHALITAESLPTEVEWLSVRNDANGEITITFRRS